MKVNTKLFGQIDIEDEKILTFDQGIVGFEKLNHFAIIYDLEQGQKASVSWLQSLDEPEMAFPVINPFLVKEDYNPEIPDGLVKTLGEIKEDNISILVTLAVPKDITNMTCNLKAPFLINSDTRKAAQVIVENSDYPVKYHIYDILQARKQKERDC